MASGSTAVAPSLPLASAEQQSASRRHKAPKGNSRAVKNEQKLFACYPWGTEDKPRVESFDHLKELRLQRNKLVSNMRPWKVETRKQKGQHYLRVMEDKIKEGERRFGANTKQWRAISSAESSIETSKREFEAIDELEDKEMARHNKKMVEIRKFRKITHDSMELAGRDACAIAEALKFDEPDEEVESDGELQNTNVDGAIGGNRQAGSEEQGEGLDGPTAANSQRASAGNEHPAHECNDCDDQAEDACGICGLWFCKAHLEEGHCCEGAENTIAISGKSAESKNCSICRARFCAGMTCRANYDASRQRRQLSTGIDVVA